MENESQEPRSDMSPQHSDKADQYAEQLLGRIMELEARLDETQEVDGGTEPITDMSPQHYDAPDTLDFDLSVFGIKVSGNNVIVSGRRVKRHRPSTYEGDLVLTIVTDTTITPALGTTTIWLNYNLETGDIAIEDSEGLESALRLYTVEKTASSIKVTRIYRPGDVDIEAVWLDYEAEEEVV